MKKKFVKQIVKSIEINLCERKEEVIIENEGFDLTKNNVDYKRLDPFITFKLKNGKEISYTLSLAYITKAINSHFKSTKDPFLTCDCGVPECAGIFYQLLRKVNKNRFHLYLEQQVVENTMKISYEKIMFSFSQEMLCKAIVQYFNKVEDYFSSIKNFAYIEDLIKAKNIPELPHINDVYLTSYSCFLEDEVAYFAGKYNVSWTQAKNLIMANEYFIFKDFYKNSKLGSFYKQKLS